MLTHWKKLLTGDCKVVLIDGVAIYPIFKNGSTSLYQDADRTLVNEQISVLDNVLVFVRDPEQRFTKGVNEYSRTHGLDVREVCSKISNSELVDRHFAPQWVWLLHLYKYHKGDVTIKAFDDIGQFCYTHTRRTKVKEQQIDLIPAFVDPDLSIMRNIDNRVPLENIVRNRNGMS